MKPTRSHNRSTHIAAALVVLIVGGLVVANIYLSAQLSHLGIYLKDMEDKTLALKKENQAIEQTVLAETALTDLSQKAEALGFTQKIQPLKLSNTPAVAYRTQ